MSKLTKWAISILLIVLILVPLVLLIMLSKREMKLYELHEKFDFREFSYGEPIQIERLDFEESFVLEGQFVSGSKRYMDLPANASSIRLQVSEGTEVQKGDVIGYNGSKELHAPENGIVDEIVLNSKTPYIRFSLLDEPVFQTKLSDPILQSLEGQDLKTEEGVPVRIVFKSSQIQEGLTEIRLAFESGGFRVGDQHSVRVMTGRRFEQVLAVDQSCVYQKEDGLYYVRLLERNDTEDFTVKGEVAVEPGLTYGKRIAITGNVSEGDWCDSGYAIVHKK